MPLIPDFDKPNRKEQKAAKKKSIKGNSNKKSVSYSKIEYILSFEKIISLTKFSF